MTRQSTRSRRHGGGGKEDNSKMLIGIGVVALLAVIIFLCWPNPVKHNIDDVEETVTAVTRGNQIKLASGLTVDLLGVSDTQQAREFLESEVKGKTVTLTADSKDATPYYYKAEEETVRAYVRVKADCTYRCLNGYLLRQHLAKVNMDYCTDSLEAYRSYENAKAAAGDGKVPASLDTDNGTLLSKVELNKVMGRASMLLVVDGRSIGTGFFINSDGFALTNVHVLQGISDPQGQNIQVYIADESGRITGERNRYFGRIVGGDPDNDWVLFTVKLDANEKVPYLNLAKQRPDTGTDVAAFGHTLGEVGTFTTGVVSGQRGNLLQISAPIDQGNSGGPVCDFYGRVVGIAQSIKVDNGQKAVSNIGFAVDIQLVREQLDKLKDVKTYGGK